MTISSTTTTVSYNGNGSTTLFPVTFAFFGASTTAEIEVIERVIATGVETTKTVTTHYTVSGGNNSTGTVTAQTAPPNTVEWHIRRITTQTQGTDYVENDAFPASSHESALDRLTMINQEQETDLNQAFQYSDTYTGAASTTVPEPVASSFLKWNAAGDALENSSTDADQYLSGNGTVAAPFYSYTSDPDSGGYRIGANNLGVAVNGAKVLDVATTGLGVTGTLSASGNVAGVNGSFSGAVTGTTGTFSGILKTDDATDATSGTDGSLQTDGGLSVVKKGFIGETLKVIGVTTHGGDVVSDTDSTDSLGTTGVRWLNVWADKINNILSPTAQYTSAEASKLSGIEASADVTDATNVTAAGALMDSELTNIAAIKAINQSLVTSADPTFADLVVTNLDGIIGASTARAGTFAALTGTVIEATTSLELASGATVTGFDATASLGSSNTLVPTQGAVKTYVDNALAASAVWQDVIYLTVSDSVYSPSASLNGRFYAVDTSGGAVTINLPQISAAGNAWAIGIKKTTSDTNAITVVRHSGDEIDEIAGNVTIGVHNSGRIFLADTGATPDSWTTQQFGAVGGNMTVQNYTVSTHFTAGSTTALTVSSAPASEQNIVVTFDGVTQHHDTYAVSGTTVTFSSAIPTGTANVEIRWGGILAINVPGDGTVTLSKMGTNSVDSDQYVDGSIDLAHMSVNSIDSDQYVDGSIDNAHLAANSVDSDNYVDGSIDKEHLSVAAKTQVIAIACGDETSDAEAATAVVTFHMPYAFTLTGVKAGVTTAPVGSTMLIDINEAGSTILTTKLMIDASEKTSATAATAAVIGGAGPALGDNALMTIDIDQIGSSTAGAGLKVYLIGYAT
tara:strand:- start:2139 stop:4697 length:2559 start_codon:yes stop_codon:yes gene_type:complete